MMELSYGEEYMSKSVYRFRMGELWEVGKNESYFTYMAEKGFHLQSIGGYLMAFEKGQPKKTKYRIEILEEEPSPEQIEIYNECGWELVTSRHIFYIFSSSENLNSIEIHTDPMEQSFVFKMINKQIKKNMIAISFIIISMAALLIYRLHLGGVTYLNLTRESSLSIVIIGILYFYIIYESIRSYIVVKKVKNSLHNGVPINHNQNWRLSLITSSALYILLIVMVLTSILMPIYTAIRRDIYTSSEFTENLPINSIKNIESKVIYDYWHDLGYDWSILSPVQYQLYEGGYVDGEMQEDYSGAYWKVGLNTKYYELIFKSMAEGLLNDLIERNFDSYSDTALVKMEDSKLDYLYVTTGEDSISIYAAHHNKVIYIRYSGKENINRIVSLLEKKLVISEDA